MSEENNNQLGQDTAQESEPETKPKQELSAPELEKVAGGRWGKLGDIAGETTDKDHQDWVGTSSPDPAPPQTIVDAFVAGFHKGQKAWLIAKGF